MYQISYASKTASDKESLLEDLTNILTEARNFNVFNQLTGVLYFADGSFFQCLEGPKECLEILINKLKKDSRHFDMKLFDMQFCDQRFFKDWSMKYVRKNSVIQQYLHDRNYAKFDPTHFSQQQINELVCMLTSLEECNV